MANEFLQHLVREAEERADHYRRYREYYDGVHDVPLTARMRQYLQVSGDKEFSANYMPIVVDSLANKLEVIGFDGDNADLVWEWWNANKFDASQFALHVNAIRDGDAYVMVEWDEERKIPRWYVQMAYDGRSGCTIHYSSEDNRPVAATKRWWVEFGESAGKMRRLNIYFPDRIERYKTTSEQNELGWIPYDDDGMGPVLDWTDSSGQPIGIPVAHFTNRARGWNYGLSELSSAIPMQDALNKAIIDLLASADTSGFRVYWLAGDDASDMTISPGIVVNSQKPRDEVEFNAFQGEPLRPGIEVVNSFIQRIAQVTGTNMSYFQETGQMASEGTHEAHEGGMISKARATSAELGTGYEKLMEIAIKVNNTFGDGTADPNLPLQTLWADFDARNEVEKMMEKSQVVINLVSAGASIKNAAIVAGFSEQDAEMLAEIDGVMDPLRRQAMMGGLNGQNFGQGGSAPQSN